MRYQFILPEDTFKSVYETFNFHKDMTYKVSHVFNDNGKFRFFITDKYGKDIEYQEHLFEYTPKTVKASEERQKRARLDFFWVNNETSFVINPSYHYNFETTEFFALDNKCVFLGDGYENVIGRIYRRKQQLTEQGWRHTEVEGSRALFKTKQDFYDYFKNIDVDKFTINGVYYKVQSSIDHLHFMLNVPKYDESLLNLPDDSKVIVVDRYVHSNELSLEAFLKVAANVIFDEEELSDGNKQTIHNIVEAYELLPKSYGPTSVSKLILGKEKKTIASVNHISGTCTNLKQPQAFALCDIVESYMYVNKIFVTKETYSSGEEWRGNFEFIGSKMINIEELTKIKNKLK